MIRNIAVDFFGSVNQPLSFSGIKQEALFSYLMALDANSKLKERSVEHLPLS